VYISAVMVNKDCMRLRTAKVHYRRVGAQLRINNHDIVWRQRAMTFARPLLYRDKISTFDKRALLSRQHRYPYVWYWQIAAYL